MLIAKTAWTSCCGSCSLAARSVTALMLRAILSSGAMGSSGDIKNFCCFSGKWTPFSASAARGRQQLIGPSAERFRRVLEAPFSGPPRLARAHPGTSVAAWCFWPLAGISGGAGPDDRQSSVGFHEKSSRRLFYRRAKRQRDAVAELSILSCPSAFLVKSFLRAIKISNILLKSLPRV